MARSLPVGIIQGARSNTLFRFLHRLIKRLSARHKPFLSNTLDFLAVFFVATTVSMIFGGGRVLDVNGISANHAEAMVAREPAPNMALTDPRDVMLLAIDALDNGMRQVAAGLDSSDSRSGVWHGSKRASLRSEEVWLQGGLVEN
jgi:hypothetical protein